MKPEEHPALSSRALRAISLTCLLGSLSLFWSGKYSPALSLLGGSFLAAALSHDPRSLWELLRRDALDAIGATPTLPFWVSACHYGATAAFVLAILV